MLAASVGNCLRAGLGAGRFAAGSHGLGLTVAGRFDYQTSGYATSCHADASVLTRRYGLPVTAADETIQAVNLSSAEARRLRVRAGTAALRVRAVGHPESPLWFEDTLYRGDRYEFHNAIGAAKRSRPASLVICGPPAPIKCGATQVC